MNDPQPTVPHEQPPRFRRFEEALYWLADHGWRQVGVSRGSHFRLEHPAYSAPLFLIYHRGTWDSYEQRQLEQSIRAIDRSWRRAGVEGAN